MSNAELFEVSKLNAAQRQLDVAIRMLFGKEDPVAVHTLVGAASVLLTDLIEIINPQRSWDKMAREANALAPSEYFQVMRRDQNFFKHARSDHGAVLLFNPEETEALAFWAVMNASELAPMTPQDYVEELKGLLHRYPEVDHMGCKDYFGQVTLVPQP